MKIGNASSKNLAMYTGNVTINANNQRNKTCVASLSGILMQNSPRNIHEIIENELLNVSMAPIALTAATVGGKEENAAKEEDHLHASLVICGVIDNV